MKIAILGNGLLGRELARQTGWDILSRSVDGIDLADTKTWKDKLQPYGTVINCIAYTNTYDNNKDNHWDVNYKGVADLVDFCNSIGSKIVHISTEFVYAENEVPPSEDELPCPAKNWYSYTKLLADEYIKLRADRYLICRELHKPNPFPYNEVWDVKTSGDTVDKISNIIVDLVIRDINGVYNIGTGDKYLKDIAPNSKVIPAPDGVPQDTRMNLDKLNKLYEKDFSNNM